MQTLLLQVLQWWSIIFLLGCVALPFTTKLFSSFFDKGYTFSKTIGIVTVSFVALLIGIFHLAPFTVFSLISILAIFAIASIFFSQKQQIVLTCKLHWKIFLFEEI